MPSADSREFQITIIPQGEHLQLSESLQNGGSATGDPALPKKHGGPNLSVQRDNGRITHIKIQCNCGQLIDVECIYKDTARAESPPKAAAPPKAAEAPKAKEPPKAAKAPAASKDRKATKGRK